MCSFVIPGIVCPPAEGDPALEPPVISVRSDECEKGLSVGSDSKLNTHSRRRMQRGNTVVKPVITQPPSQKGVHLYAVERRM